MKKDGFEEYIPPEGEDEANAPDLESLADSDEEDDQQPDDEGTPSEEEDRAPATEVVYNADAPHRLEMIRLSCGLSDAELASYAQRMTSAALEIERIESLKKRIKPLQKQLTVSAHAVNSGVIVRDVDVAVMYDQPRAGLKTYVRLDTGEAYHTEPMEVTDNQLEIGFWNAGTENGEEAAAIDAGREEEDTGLIIPIDSEVHLAQLRQEALEES